MSVVKINAITVPEGMGPALEGRFAARARAVEGMPGFEGFELLRPTAGESRYFVYTRWASEEDFRNWVNSEAFGHGHRGNSAASGQPDSAGGHPGGAGGHPGGEAPVAPNADLLEFEVVDLAGS